MTSAHASESRRLPTAWVAGGVLGTALLFAAGCATAQSPVRSPASPSTGSSDAAARATHAGGTVGALGATSSSASAASAASATPRAGVNSRSTGVHSGANPGSSSAGGTARTGSTAAHQAQPSATPLSAGGKWIISTTQLRVASGPTLLSSPTAPLTFSVEEGTAALLSGVRTITAAVDVYPYSARGSAATVALTRAAFTLDLLHADAGAGNPPVVAWSLPHLSATIAENTSALLHVQLSVPAGVPGGQYALALADTPVKAAVADHTATVAPPDWQNNTSATAQVSLPSLPGTAWTGAISGGATGSTGVYHAQIVSLKCTGTGCEATFTVTAPVPGGFGPSGSSGVTAVAADGTATPLTTTGVGAGGGATGGGTGYRMEGDLNFDPVPAGSTALRIRIVTGPSATGTKPVAVTIIQPLK